MRNVKEEIKAFVVNNFTFGDEKSVTYTVSFLDSGIIDSTGILELVEFLEKEYKITIYDDELVPENLECIEKIELFLKTKRKAA
jgi:acyl carrier protein